MHQVAISYCHLDERNVTRTRALAAKLREDFGFTVVIDVLNKGDMSWPQFINKMFECPKVCNMSASFAAHLIMCKHTIYI